MTNNHTIIKEASLIEVTEFGGQNWLIAPAASAVNEPRPTSISHQKWLLVLSGVAIINLKGEKTTDWLRDSVHILPDIRGPVDYAVNRYAVPQPPGTEGGTYQMGFQVEQWSPFAGLSAVFDEHESIDAGFAVDRWRPSPFASGTDAFSAQPVDHIFTGIVVDAAVRDSDAWLYRVGYNITLLGHIVFTAIPIII
jgi:hypothetical protein